MQYLNDFDLSTNRADIALDEVHKMALEAQALENACTDMEAEGWYVNKETLVTTLFWIVSIPLSVIR